MTSAILPRPKAREDRTGPELWVDEAIWGHRLHDEQTPWLTLLEFLGVLQAEDLLGRALTEASPNALSYKPQQQLKLRNVLFNNPHIVTLRKEQRNDDDKWATWLARMKDSAGGLENRDFSYLRKHFSSFHDFASVVAFLQSSAIEGNSNKRWSSKFVFPFGGTALYEDVKVTESDGVSNDRRFFGRTGEILYLMLCRSRLAPKLKEQATKRLLTGEGPYNALVRVLQGESEHAKQERGGSYLPLASHPAFDRLAEDWLSLLSCKVPAYDIIPHMVTMTGLNLVLYQLQRAREVIGGDERVTLVWEIIAPKRTKVRELSEKSFQENNVLPGQAVDHYIRSVGSSPEWEAALKSEEPRLAAAELLSELFDWPDEEEMADVSGEPAQLLEHLVRKAQVRHRQHVGKFHGTWARQIGMSSRRSSRSTRYAPTDRLLKTLVVCSVDGRQELKNFLALLWERYGIIVGDHQADQLINQGVVDRVDFAENATRLEERLASLGLLERFSDSCAYVVNPFERTTA